jgi:hypothetical protein
MNGTGMDYSEATSGIKRRVLPVAALEGNLSFFFLLEMNFEN